ncbi:MAG: hypothetical protein B1H11_06085 [Desulfobacteraceae bacterium 4484_190.1]|nr:MAG: hypothetical protein B1H11_06085 [Desulfobacteraceae bacterium 4484_190.1]
MMFDPVRTAQYGLDSYGWSAQKRIFIPFHFLPPRPLETAQYSFITEPNSVFAHKSLAQINALILSGTAIPAI